MKKVWIAMIGLVGLAAVSQADLISDQIADASATAYSANASSADLLNGLAAESTTGTWDAGGTAVLNDGVHGTAADVGTAAWARPNASVTYDLGVGSGLGWSLTSIRSIASWTDPSGFGSQDFTIEIEGVGGGGFVLLTTQEYEPLGFGAGGSTQVTLTDDTGFLATGVQKIRFTHNFNADAITGQEGSTVYRELDVFGEQTTIPEPTTIGMLGLGAAVMLFIRRRVA